MVAKVKNFALITAATAVTCYYSNKHPAKYLQELAGINYKWLISNKSHNSGISGSRMATGFLFYNQAPDMKILYIWKGSEASPFDKGYS